MSYDLNAGNAHGGESNPKCTMAAKLNTLESV